MKKVTIVLFIVLCIVFVGRCYYESQKPPVRYYSNMEIMAMQAANKQISNYAGVKKRGSDVKALISLVETLNIQEVFPIDIRYGDILPDSYDWVAPTTQNLSSGDRKFIRDSAYYEVVMQDQIRYDGYDGEDGYLDTITIRAYKQPETTTNSTSLSGE